MSKVCVSSKPPVQFLFLKAAALAQLKIPQLLTPKLPSLWSEQETSVHVHQSLTVNSGFLSFAPLPLLPKYPILQLLLNQVQKLLISLRQHQTLRRKKWGRKRTCQCSQVPQRWGTFPWRNQLQLGNACTARWQRLHNGERVQWGRRPFAMHAEFVIGLGASFLSTVLLLVLPLFHRCTPTLTRRLLRWERRVVLGQEWLTWTLYHRPCREYLPDSYLLDLLLDFLKWEQYL